MAFSNGSRRTADKASHARVVRAGIECIAAGSLAAGSLAAAVTNAADPGNLGIFGVSPSDAGPRGLAFVSRVGASM